MILPGKFKRVTIISKTKIMKSKYFLCSALSDSKSFPKDSINSILRTNPVDVGIQGWIKQSFHLQIPYK